MRLRRGHLLAEALCALALAGLLAATAGLALTGARRALHASERQDRAQRAERDAVAILREALSAGGAIVTRGDTAVDFDMLLGSAVVCETEANALLLPNLTDGSGLTQMPQPAAADDVVALRLPNDVEEEWWYGVLDSVQQRRIPGACAAADGWRMQAEDGQPLLRLTLLDPLPADVQPGTPLRLLRRGRFTLYHAGGGQWMLGWRKCHPLLDLCGVVQPVAGPLRTPSAGGLRFRAVEGQRGLEIEARGADGGRGARATLHW